MDRVSKKPCLQASDLVALLGLICAAVLIANAVEARQILYADGSYLAFAVLDGSFLEIWLEAWFRIAGFVATQGFVAVLAASGVRDLGFLALAYGLAFHGWSLLSLVLSWWLVGDRKDLFVFPLAGFFVLQVNAMMFPTEVHLLAALFWPIFFALLKPVSGHGRWLLLIGCLVWAFVHEAALFGTTLLLPLAILQARRVPALWPLVPALALSCFTAVLALSELDPIRRANGENFIMAWRLIRYHYAVLIGVGAILGIGVLILLTPARMKPWAALGLCFVILLMMAYLAMRPALLRPEFHYAVRFALSLALPLLGLCAVIANQHGRSWMSGWPALVLSVLIVSQSAYGVYLTQQWRGYIAVYREIIENNQGVVEVGDTVLNTEILGDQLIGRFNWDWTHVIFSMMLAPEGRVKAVVDDRRKTFAPLNPFELRAPAQRFFDTSQLRPAYSLDSTRTMSPAP